MTARCTCAGPSPGWPQHEWWCGLPERDDDCSCGSTWIDAGCVEHAHLILPAESDQQAEGAA